MDHLRPATRPPVTRGSAPVLLLVLWLLAAAQPGARALAVLSPPEPDRELLVTLPGGGEAILPTWRTGRAPGGLRQFSLDDLLRLEGLLADVDGPAWTLQARGHRVRVVEGLRFVEVDGTLLSLDQAPVNGPDGLLVELELLRRLLASGLLQGRLDEGRDELALQPLPVALERETVPGGELLRLRLPEIPVFESVPGAGRLDLRLPDLDELAGLEDPARLKPGGDPLIRGLTARRDGGEWVLGLALSSQAELVDVEEVEALGEIQVLLRRRGAVVAAGPLHEPAPEEEAPAPALTGLREELTRIVIDAGHGGHDPGAVSRWGKSEKDLTLAIALELRERLRRELPGVDVLLTRERDEYLPLGERTRRANQAQGQLFVSIHINAAKDRRARGHEVFFLRPGMNEHARQVALRENSQLDFEGPDAQGERPPEDWILASMAQSGWAEESRGVAQLLSRHLGRITERRRRPVQQAGFQVLVGASMPAVLVECGFLTNGEDHRQLASGEGQRALAQALAAGLKELHALSAGQP
ncbi:MAG: N-acetylmuramoyl-L-alanine amidase [Candidatus Delongbacteria bacterium]